MEATEFDKLGRIEHRGQAVLCREPDEASSLSVKYRARKRNEGTGVLSGHRGECVVELVGVPHPHDL
jgi:hypothetical protein